MGATSRFSGAVWELQTAFLKAPEEYTDSQEALEKQFVTPVWL
jgi:hypothetical protein